MSRTRQLLAAVAALGMLIAPGCIGEDAPAVPLRDVDAFDTIADPVERSKALFVEAGRVIQHPRCLNCHPTDAHPRQGDAMAFHQPPVVRGEGGHGVAAMRCDTCHLQENVDHAGVPGNPSWHLAPIEQGWIGESLNTICEQIKDPETNGGLELDALHEHMAHDSLVGWAWAPGTGREPAPGTQASFGELIAAWIETGAHCPDGVAGAASGPEMVEVGDCANCHEREFTVATY